MNRKKVKRNASATLISAGEAALRDCAEKQAEEIDFSDIPPLDEDFWQNSIRNPFCRPVKVHVSVRIDADILAWLKNNGKGYQTRLNKILRQAMLQDAQAKA